MKHLSYILALWVLLLSTVPLLNLNFDANMLIYSKNYTES
jgi:hypothetical protein